MRNRLILFWVLWTILGICGVAISLTHLLPPEGVAVVLVASGYFLGIAQSVYARIIDLDESRRKRDG